MKIFAICIYDLLVIRNLIRFYANFCPDDSINLKSKKTIINFFVDFGELMTAIAVPVLLLRYF